MPRRAEEVTENATLQAQVGELPVCPVPGERGKCSVGFDRRPRNIESITLLPTNFVHEFPKCGVYSWVTSASAKVRVNTVMSSFCPKD